MDQLILRYSIVQRALKTLKQAIELSRNSSQCANEDLKEAFKDSLIKRFTYSFEETVRYIQMYLVKVLKVKLEVKTPASVFRMCLNTELISE